MLKIGEVSSIGIVELNINVSSNDNDNTLNK